MKLQNPEPMSSQMDNDYAHVIVKNFI